MMNLLLIRHGATDWADKRLAGCHSEVHLNEEGQAQAQALALWLAGVPASALYSSPLERALETAQPLAEKWGLTVQVRQKLTEVGFGEWAGRTLEELAKEEQWQVIHSYPGGARFPGGESLREVQARMVAELDAIRDNHADQTVAVISHADPIRMALAYYVGLPLDLFQRLSVAPAAVSALTFTRYGPRILCLNCTASLPPFQLEQQSQDKER